MSASEGQKPKPFDPTAQYNFAFDRLFAVVQLKRTSGARRAARKRKVEQIADERWRVTGGHCVHTVVAANGGPVVHCIDHSPEHPATEPGYVCCHELAVYRSFIPQIVAELFTPEGFLREGIS